MINLKIAYEHDTGMLDPEPRRFSYTTVRYERNATESPLLRLPPELRHLIFTHVLGGWEFTLHGGRTGRCRAICDPMNDDDNYHMLGILRVCRQIYAEARLLSFTLNVFRCDDRETAKRWTKRMPAQMGAVRALKVAGLVNHYYGGEESQPWVIRGNFCRMYLVISLFGRVVRVDVDSRVRNSEHKPLMVEAMEN